MTITNLMRVEMELMYLAHVNFQPVDNGRLVYSAPCTLEHIAVRTSLPPGADSDGEYVSFLEELAQDLKRHNRLVPGLPFDPEVVLIVDYLSDAEGWAHAVQVRPDGSADYIRHRPDELDTGVRWISRTGDQEALGITLPATAEHEGYLAEKAKGNLKMIPVGGRFHCAIEAGVLAPAEAGLMETKIAGILDARG